MLSRRRTHIFIDFAQGDCFLGGAFFVAHYEDCSMMTRPSKHQSKGRGEK
jgi:hypothetical protein